MIINLERLHWDSPHDISTSTARNCTSDTTLDSCCVLRSVLLLLATAGMSVLSSSRLVWL